VRVALGPLAPGGGGLPHRDRGDAVRAVIQMQHVRVEAERRHEGGVHTANFRVATGRSGKSRSFHPERPGATARRFAETYLALRWRKPKPSERVRVAVNVSNSIGVGYGAAIVAAGVW